jgi:hypothetical protein
MPCGPSHNDFGGRHPWTEHLEMDTSTRKSHILNMHKALLKQMSNSDVIPGKMKARFERIEGSNNAVLNGEVILKRFKLFKRHGMNAVAPLLPKNIHEIPSGEHLWKAFQHGVCLDLHWKQQKAPFEGKAREKKDVLLWVGPRMLQDTSSRQEKRSGSPRHMWLLQHGSQS